VTFDKIKDRFEKLIPILRTFKKKLRIEDVEEMIPRENHLSISNLIE